MGQPAANRRGGDGGQRPDCPSVDEEQGMVRGGELEMSVHEILANNK